LQTPVVFVNIDVIIFLFYFKSPYNHVRN
ncbi:hypothetical protein TNCT_526091, partial [Trichonephila clavata]